MTQTEPVPASSQCAMRGIKSKLLEKRGRYFIEGCLPEKLLPYMDDCLSIADIERIQACQRTDGATAAMAKLISALQKKSNGCDKLVIACREIGDIHLAMLLDPKEEVTLNSDDEDISQNKHKILEILGTVSDIVVISNLVNCKPSFAANVRETEKLLLKEFSTSNKESEKLRSIRKDLTKILPKGTTFVGLSEGSLHLIFRATSVEGLGELAGQITEREVHHILENRLLDDFRAPAEDPSKPSLRLEHFVLTKEDYDRAHNILKSKTERKENELLLRAWRGDEEGLNMQLDEEPSPSNYPQELRDLIEQLKVPAVDTFDDPARMNPLELRDYQVELAQPALEGKNVIMQAPTGSGKTYVAMYVIKNHFEQLEREGGDAADKRKPALFIVNRIPLVAQQKRRFDLNVPNCRIKELCGGSASDIHLSYLIKDYDVLVLTAQIVVNALQSSDADENKVDICDFSMMVFDECHHTNKDHAYNVIMSHYLSAKENPLKRARLPQIIGMTASLGVGGAKTSKSAVEHIIRLCANLDAEELKINEDEKNIEEMKKNVAAPMEILKETKKRKCDVFEDAFVKVMKRIERRVPTYSKEIPSEQGTQQYEQWVVASLKNANLEGIRDPVTCLEQLRLYNSALMINNDSRSKDALLILENYFDDLNQDSLVETDRELCKFYETARNAFLKAERLGKVQLNPKLVTLMEELLTNHKRNVTTGEEELDNISAADQPRGILFVRTRDLTMAISEWIKETPELDFLKPEILVGGQNRNDSGGMTQQQQIQIINKFKTGECNLLISTTVSEEGLNIEDCSYVIRYDMPGNEISTQQARGRIRAKQKDARFTLVVDQKRKAQEQRNAVKEVMMHEAVEKVNKMSKEEYRIQVKKAQEKAIQDNILQARMKELHRSKYKENDNIIFLCKKCSVKACTAADIRLYNTSRIVIEPSFKGVAFFDSSKTGKKVKEVEPVAKVFCKSCNTDWGTLTKFWGGKPVPVIKVASFIIQLPNKMKDQFKKWKDVPFTVQEIENPEDIHLIDLGCLTDEDIDESTGSTDEEASRDDTKNIENGGRENQTGKMKAQSEEETNMIAAEEAKEEDVEGKGKEETNLKGKEKEEDIRTTDELEEDEDDAEWFDAEDEMSKE